MVIPLGKQVPDEHHPTACLRHAVAWGADGISLADTRTATRDLLARAGHPPEQQVSQDAQLVVSELVTNALRHAPGPGGLLLEVLPDAPTRLRITVHDTSPQAPRPRVPDPRRVGGHGIHLLTRLCDHLDTDHRAGGKHVTAEIHLPLPGPCPEEPGSRVG
ncbi:ATP-binding protein [Streptomyces sp. NPDC005930]|uniref:ATP-binding protein n=1 Tax=Streptomyces sp. NPDC005930 TaxID=3364736 RepID=UPI00367EF5C1